MESKTGSSSGFAMLLYGDKRLAYLKAPPQGSSDYEFFEMHNEELWISLCESSDKTPLAMLRRGLQTGAITLQRLRKGSGGVTVITYDMKQATIKIGGPDGTGGGEVLLAHLKPLPKIVSLYGPEPGEMNGYPLIVATAEEYSVHPRPPETPAPIVTSVAHDGSVTSVTLSNGFVEQFDLPAQTVLDDPNAGRDQRIAAQAVLDYWKEQSDE